MCFSDQVDLVVDSFRLEDSGSATTILQTGMFVDFDLKLHSSKTTSGFIPASSADPDDFSIMFYFYMSTDQELSADDVEIPITLTSDQKTIMKSGLSATKPSSYEIAIDGSNLKIIR